MDNEESPAICPACYAKRMHTVREWREFHPLAGHGAVDGVYTHPDLTVAELKRAS